MFRFGIQLYRASVAIALLAPVLAWGNLETGTDAYNGGEYALALHELLPLAEKGNAEAQYVVGEMFANGQGVPKNEMTAADWFVQAAGGGSANAQLALGDMYSLGRGVAENDAIAAYWRWRAATTFVAAARRNLNAGLKKADADPGKVSGRISPKAADCKAPAYAHDIQHFGDGGSVDLLLLVDADGKVLDTSILASSEWPRLDQIARDAYSACAFTPAKVDGKPVPGVVRIPYVWKTN